MPPDTNPLKFNDIHCPRHAPSYFIYVLMGFQTLNRSRDSVWSNVAATSDLTLFSHQQLHRLFRMIALSLTCGEADALHGMTRTLS
jgi:hypothetical protein